MSGSKMTSVPAVQRVMGASVRIADRAAEIIRGILRAGDLGIVQKTGINDLQTEADRSAQRCIVANLARQFPRLTIIGEEEPDDRPVPDDWIVESGADPRAETLQCPEGLTGITEDQIVVWVDPLDGTKEFTQGLLDHVTVLIGIAAGGEPAAGVINQPYFNYQHPSEPQGRTIFGLRGGGVAGFEPRAPPADSRIVTTTRSHSTGLVQSALQALQPDQVLAVGGAGHKVMLLLEGRAHAYVFASPGCKKWDTCAPEAILTALGGRLTDIHGVQLRYEADVQHMNATGVLATAPGVEHDWYVQRIPADVRDGLKPKSG
ncbi:3'(2'),5'-bisphosphate nucleotidase 1 [Amphibalanus amphitrite]|uniref:3'(2'),5'-bisphosphate nucleotidase 1 n=1 Tax=Amphibalanus amphitrite TaxID=1232801 RepID=A0A6A4VUL8_AMPAM|nr:3'(2'),5'-bisphosphate nucleotidase 1 [Amphibalanus amphitrite]